MSAVLAHRLFAFDTVFDEAGVIAYTPPPSRHTLTAEDLDVVRAEGFAAGERSALAVAQEAQAYALRQIAEAVGGALSTLAHAAHEHRRGSAELALAAARRIADAALDRFPEAPVAAALASLAGEVESAPRLTVRVGAADEAAVRAAVEHAAATAGFSGRLTLTVDPDAPAAAFSFDWGDGRAAFDPERAAARVAEALDAALAAEGLHAEPLAPEAHARDLGAPAGDRP